MSRGTVILLDTQGHLLTVGDIYSLDEEIRNKYLRT